MQTPDSLAQWTKPDRFDMSYSNRKGRTDVKLGDMSQKECISCTKSDYVAKQFSVNRVSPKKQEHCRDIFGKDVRHFQPIPSVTKETLIKHDLNDPQVVASRHVTIPKSCDDILPRDHNAKVESSYEYFYQPFDIQRITATVPIKNVSSNVAIGDGRRQVNYTTTSQAEYNRKEIAIPSTKLETTAAQNPLIAASDPVDYQTVTMTAFNPLPFIQHAKQENNFRLSSIRLGDNNASPIQKNSTTHRDFSNCDLRNSLPANVINHYADNVALTMSTNHPSHNSTHCSSYSTDFTLQTTTHRRHEPKFPNTKCSIATGDQRLNSYSTTHNDTFYSYNASQPDRIYPSHTPSNVLIGFDSSHELSTTHSLTFTPHLVKQTNHYLPPQIGGKEQRISTETISKSSYPHYHNFTRQKPVDIAESEVGALLLGKEGTYSTTNECVFRDREDLWMQSNVKETGKLASVRDSLPKGDERLHSKMTTYRTEFCKE